jgi:hypothetical protein
MSENKDNNSTKELLKFTNEHSIRSNSYRFCNLETTRKYLGDADNQAVDHDSSILSPGVYFLDLLGLIKKKTVLPYFILRLSI